MIEKVEKREAVRRAIMLGGLCSVSYLAVYVARNMLSTVTPQLLEENYTAEYIGIVSSLYFITYAIGQLINGILGERIKARYMISFGLLFAGVCNALFSYIVQLPSAARIVYGMSGFFLAMIYAPMTKVVAENTEPIYATRCSLGYTFASLLGSPIAGILATIFVWQNVFRVGSAVLIIMGILCFALFLLMEKKKIIQYNCYVPKVSQKKENGILILLKHRIVKFTLIAIITGVVRTTVVFWMPTFISQYLGFTSEQSTAIFTVATIVISMATFVGVLLYERLRRNMDLTIMVTFISAAVCFGMVYLIKVPAVTILFLVLGILSSNAADSMLWSRYCLSLRDTGMVSTATGFLDFVSYVAAAVASSVFANAANTIGWKNLILIWFGLMVLGVVISLPWKRNSIKNE